MTTALLPWGGANRPDSLLNQVPIAIKEFKRHIVPLAAIFATIALSILFWGMIRPATYESSATVLVEDNNIIAPLMQGRTVPTDAADRATIAREVAFSRRVMDEILRSGGWMESNPSPVEQERLIGSISERTSIEVMDRGRTRARADDPRINLIRITYSDTDAKRAHLVTKRYSELLMAESMAAKAKESSGAFEFIGAEAAKYRALLSNAEGNLQRYRSVNPDARDGVESDVTARIGELHREVANARLNLVDLASQERQLQAQLSGENEISTVSRSSQLRARLAELQTELDRLSLNYTSRHPDVIRVQNQMRDVQRQILGGGGLANGVASAGSMLGPPSLNPLYSELRSRLANIRQQKVAAAARESTASALLGQELSRSRKIVEAEGTLSALTRDHAVNSELYQDLLRRRENARVSMNLDANGQASNFQIQEPASMPLLPSGMRLMHVSIIGLGLATLVPLLLLAFIVRRDPRVRSSMGIERDAGLPVLGAIPTQLSRKKRVEASRRAAFGTALFVAVPVIYGLVMIAKMVTYP
ncbi:hypothetical protein [Aerolutibacter ruishenii]|uniref:Polysaccharide chain length determinant protein (PEP-CTERM system associated) n=1 Tax=Aerolutibacter ruishenii TaxID=686800 RepID=A0A562LY25_9GAMM|nr:hypothetical protein [Lysobacter ruishenii]TWI12472.1 polysaccharide chain length determinant protein (PEP-CTERM system associated) [Lysobacter ruishenii]